MKCTVITNDPNGNFVVSADIKHNGTLVSHPRMTFLFDDIFTGMQSLRQAVYTGGSGGHGVSNSNGPDALFSQGSVKTSQAANMLATVSEDPSAVTYSGLIQ
jgi:hypothetical protein